MLKHTIGLLLLAIFSIACGKNTTPDPEIITVKDTVYVTTTEFDTVFVTQWDTVFIQQQFSDSVTTFIITRHAEKETAGTNPNLTATGMERANRLAKMLEEVSVKMIYSTNLNRTEQTVESLATQKGLTITNYGTSPNYAQLTQQFITENLGETAVISGHSNTVPSILSAFTSGDFQITIDESDYENLFIVTVPKSGEGMVKVMHLKY